MKTQISRNSLQPEKHYSGLYLQQGRMITDADWNELTDIEKERLVAALADVVSSGAPRTGGLRLIAVPSGSTNVRIAPGVIYVEGVPARLEAEYNLAINTQPDYPLQADYSGQSLCLYADVWERTVTALEDAALMDPALHGADTASRSQTMVQVKWCPTTGTTPVDLMDDQVNPPQGTAELSLRLALITGSADSCDPCASQVDVDERIGNSLFRVEVHDFDRDAQILTLKWSRDNGAEACRVAEMPAGFNQGPWVWEFYDDNTERLLGNHFAPNAKNLRGLLRTTCTEPTGAAEPKTYVRQWDGYLTIDLKTLSGSTLVFSGVDRGVPLAQGAAGSASHGRVAASDGKISINLERMELHLDTKEKLFVPGDFWLATVRESVQVSGQYILPPTEGLAVPARGATPCGIRHHYLVLGEIGINKKLVAGDDPFIRQMHFPPLSDIQAGDVGYAIPVCENQQNTLKDLLAPDLDLNGDGQVNLRHVLDTLLCRLRADRLPLNKQDTALCSELQGNAVVTVQDALRVLCDKSTISCSVVATSSAQLAVLLQEFAADSSALDLWICLPAGTYPIATEVSLSGKRSLRISGQGPRAVRITCSAAQLNLEADEIVLENLTLSFATGSGQLAIRAGESRTSNCRFSRTTTVKGPPMVSVGGQGSADCTLAWENNRLDAIVKKVTASNSAWIEAIGAGNDKLKESLAALTGAELLANRDAYDAAIRQVVATIIALPKTTRAAWSTNLQEIAAPTRIPVFAVRRVGSAALVEALSKEKPNALELAAALEEIVAVGVSREPDYALRLETAKVGGVLAKNRVSGWVLLANGVSGYRHPTVAVIGSTLDGAVVKSGGNDLRLVENSFEGLKANLPAGSVNDENRLTVQVSGYARLIASGNTIEQGLNSLVTAHFVGQGNTWSREGTDPLGSVIGDRGVFTGNLLDTGTATLQITSTMGKDQLRSGGNLEVDLVSAT
nr:DUF6519 domain-containing protein [uncultured Desulfobulbus sp.]